METTRQKHKDNSSNRMEGQTGKQSQEDSLEAEENQDDNIRIDREESDLLVMTTQRNQDNKT